MTGNWCEHCHTQQPSKPKHSICTSCDDQIGMCRLCRLSLQVKRGKNVVTLRQTPDSCRQQKWACATCGKRDFKLQLCEGCMCARYCSRACQKRDGRSTKRSASSCRRNSPCRLSTHGNWSKQCRSSMPAGMRRFCRLCNTLAAPRREILGQLLYGCRKQLLMAHVK